MSIAEPAFASSINTSGPADDAVGLDPVALPTIAETASGRIWRLREADARTVLAIEQQQGLAPIVARAIAARGVDAETVGDFLNPSLRALMPDPYVLTDMQRLAERLADAIVNGEQVGLFGDYDVDGTTSAAIFFRYFASLGQHLHVYLPDRAVDGYGPSLSAFRQLKERGAEIIVTVDCGANAGEVIAGARAEGLETLVVDHHLMSGPAPEEAGAVVNPQRADDASGLENMSAAGLSFLTLVAVNRVLRARGYFKARQEPKLLALLDLAALGLVCDVMAMTGLTRVLVAQGLKVLAGGGNKGLAALSRHAGASKAPTTYDLGFLLGPRINAAGRIGHAQLAFDLLTSEDVNHCDGLAERLHTMNAERQEIEAGVLQAALGIIKTQSLDAAPVIVVAGEGWHAGVIGIVAGRLKEKFDKPVIVIGVENGVGKGSGRSIDGVDLGGAIARAREAGRLVAGGGHAMAAGLTIDPAAIDDFRAYLTEYCAEAVAKALEGREARVDGVISAQAVKRTLADAVACAGPFGPKNPEPIFVLANMRVTGVKLVGANHLACTLTSETGDKVRAIAFRADETPLGDYLREGGLLHLSGKVRADSWRGGDAASFQISDAARP